MQTPTKKQYSQRVKEASPNSPILKNCALAFLFGGLICTLGQALFHWYSALGAEMKDARAFVSITLIFLSAAITALGWYDDIAKHAGAGTLVPITGFANSVVSPAMEFKAEGFITGLGAKLFVVSGPVIVFGVIASIVYGLICYVINLL